MVKKINKNNKNNDNIKVKKIKNNLKSKNNKNQKIITRKESNKNEIKINNELSNNSIIIYNILKYLNVDDIHLCSMVNKEWNKVSNSNKIWELLFLKNIFEIKNFINENEIYSNGCLKQQFSNDSFRFKDLYRICFPDHFDRFILTNKFKKIEIISNDGNGNSNKILSNIKNFENKLIKTKSPQDETKSYSDKEKEISKTIIDYIDYCFNIKSSFKMGCSWTKNKLVKIFLISSKKEQLSINGELWPDFNNFFEYLICVPNNVESNQDGKKTTIEYSRFIQMVFNIDVTYNAENHFINDDSDYRGELLKTCTQSFHLFDIDNPTFDRKKNIRFVEYKDKELKKNKTISTLELWHQTYSQYNNHQYFVSNQFIKGLNEFSRNLIEFGKNGLFSYSFLYINFEDPITNYKHEMVKQFNNVEWKLKLYLNCRNILRYSFEEYENILQFIENSTILKFQKSNSIGFYRPHAYTNLEFGFSIPYENNVLTVSIYYQFGLAGDYRFGDIFDELNFTIKFKFNEEKYNNLYKCITDDNGIKPKTSIEFKKELIENINVDNLLFQDFISILFKNQFPLLKFKFSSLLRVIEFNKFISFNGKFGKKIPELSEFIYSY